MDSRSLYSWYDGLRPIFLVISVQFEGFDQIKILLMIFLFSFIFLLVLVHDGFHGVPHGEFIRVLLIASFWLRNLSSLILELGMSFVELLLYFAFLLLQLFFLQIHLFEFLWIPYSLWGQLSKIEAPTLTLSLALHLLVDSQLLDYLFDVGQLFIVARWLLNLVRDFIGERKVLKGLCPNVLGRLVRVDLAHPGILRLTKSNYGVI